MMTFLIYYIGVLTLYIVSIYMFSKLTNRKILKMKISGFWIWAAATLHTIINVLKINVIVPFLTLICFCFLFKKLFNESLKKTIIYSIIIWSISLIIDVITMLVMNFIQIYGIDNEWAEILKVVSSLVMSLILFIISQIKICIKFINKFYEKLDKLKINKIGVIGIVLLFFVIGLLCFNNMDNQYIIISVLILAIVLCILICCFISLNYQIVTLKETNSILEQSNEASLELISEYRILKHNLEHNLLGIKTVSNKKTKELIDALIAEYNSKFYIKHDITSMPAGINGFILEKFYKYAEEDLKITVENKIKKKILGLLGPRNYNLFCEALGVTLDNALESTVKSKEKLLYLEFKETEESLMATVANTFTGNIELDKLGTKEYTSRKTGHGLGLYSLFNRKNLFITTSIKNNLFINKIEVKKRKDN